jgi:lipopolysaccharide heptosyltransferase II
LEHQAEHYLDIARELGADVPDKERRLSTAGAIANRPSLISAANRRLKLGLCPGAEYGPAKRWFPERFTEVAAAISEEVPADWILFGTSKDIEIGAAIVESLGDRCVNRIGQTTLDQLIAELRECEMLLTNDTGTMHLATLLAVPVVAVFGSTESSLTGPLGSDHRVLRHQVECSPCFLRECPIDFRCMKAVTVEEVVAAVVSRLM